MSLPKIGSLPPIPPSWESFKQKNPQLALITSLAFAALGIACSVGAAILMIDLPFASLALGAATVPLFAVSVALMIKVVKKDPKDKKTPPKQPTENVAPAKTKPVKAKPLPSNKKV